MGSLRLGATLSFGFEFGFLLLALAGSHQVKAGCGLYIHTIPYTVYEKNFLQTCVAIFAHGLKLLPKGATCLKTLNRLPKSVDSMQRSNFQPVQI